MYSLDIPYAPLCSWSCMELSGQTCCIQTFCWCPCCPVASGIAEPQGLLVFWCFGQPFWFTLLKQCCLGWIRLILEIDSSWSSAIALYNALQNVVFSALWCLTSQANQLSNLFSLRPIVVESSSHGFTLVAIRKQHQVLAHLISFKIQPLPLRMER